MNLLEQARAHEKAGRAEAAVKAYREAGAVDDAARLLSASLRKPRDAAELLLGSLRVEPAQVGQLDGPGKKRALMAAIFFGKAGEHDTAVKLLMALGEQQRAVDLLQRAGDSVGAARLASMKPGQFLESASLVAAARASPAVGGLSIASAQRLEQQGKPELALEQYVQLRRFADAARLALKLGRVEDAAQLAADAGLPWEAAQAYAQLGETAKALENLTRVPRDHEHYRAAVVQAVGLAADARTMDFRFEHFLGPFIAAGPQEADEIAAFDQLAHLYAAHGNPGNAKEVLEKIAGRAPAQLRVRERIAALDAELRPSAAVARQVMENADLHARRSPSLSEVAPALPDLGELPGLEEPATMMRPAPAVAEAAREAPRPLFDVGAQLGAGRYRLEGKLGQGGMASVWKAWDTDLEEHVALKVYSGEHTNDILLQRFKQELKLSRQLQHPNIIRLYDIGLHDGHRYISMELLVGKSLKDRLQTPLPFAEALDLLQQACAGLGAAHAAGVIHRDVKPDNFFVTDKGILKVMDFGIAKQHAAPGVTVAGSIAGTPLYMSPEQISNFSTVTHLTDLYALGICAYEMFTGSVPFTHAELVPLLMMQVRDQPEPPRRRNPNVPPDLESIILRLMEKEPAQRFQSCAELSEALGAVRGRYRV